MRQDLHWNGRLGCRRHLGRRNWKCSCSTSSIGDDSGSAGRRLSSSSSSAVVGLDIRHLAAYGALLLLAALLVFLRAVALVTANVRACRRVHDEALWAVLRSPMSFFDTTPSGRVFRFTSDQQRVDMQLRNQMSSLLNSAFQLLSGVAVVLLATPLVALVLPPLALGYTASSGSTGRRRGRCSGCRCSRGVPFSRSWGRCWRACRRCGPSGRRRRSAPRWRR